MQHEQSDYESEGRVFESPRAYHLHLSSLLFNESTSSPLDQKRPDCAKTVSILPSKHTSRRSLPDGVQRRAVALGARLPPACSPDRVSLSSTETSFTAPGCNVNSLIGNGRKSRSGQSPLAIRSQFQKRMRDVVFRFGRDRRPPGFATSSSGNSFARITVPRHQGPDRWG